MQINQILAAINQPKNKQTTAHAAQLANIYKLLKEIKPDINGIELQDTVLLFGRETEEIRVNYWNNEFKLIVHNKGTELPAKQFCITTTYGGSYKFTVPTGNAFFVAVCTLLNINSEFICPPSAPVEYVKESIFVDAGVIDAINKAAKFVLKTDKSWDRPGLQGVLLEISGGFLTVVGCDAHRLYKSAPFKCNGTDQQIIIKPGLGKLLQPKNTNSIEIQVLSEIKEGKAVIPAVSINQTIFEIIDAKYPDYAAVIPEYDQFMEFETKEFINQVKKVLPAANKTTKQVVFHLNGSINLKTQDLDFGNEMQSDMPYISKNFPDMDMGLRGKQLISCLAAFSGVDKVRMYSAGNPNRAAIFTADQQKEIVLLMPVMLNA